MNYNFKPAKFVKENSMTQQIMHVLSEAEEVKQAVDAIGAGSGSVDELEMELGDLYHSLETLWRIKAHLEGKASVALLFQQVYDKNDERGYYE